MAIHHVQVTAFSRGQGVSAVHRASYRLGMKLRDDAKHETYDYTRKMFVEHIETIYPEGWPAEIPQEPEKFWNWVESKEKRRDACTCKEIRLSLPHDLDSDTRLLIARDFIRDLVKTHGFVADISRHADPGNDHVHVLVNTRRFKNGKFEKIQEIDIHTGGEETVEFWREEWAQRVNREFIRRGMKQRIYASKAKQEAAERLITLEKAESLLNQAKRAFAKRACDVQQFVAKVIATNDKKKTFVEKPQQPKTMTEEQKKEALQELRNSIDENIQTKRQELLEQFMAQEAKEVEVVEAKPQIQHIEPENDEPEEYSGPRM